MKKIVTLLTICLLGTSIFAQDDGAKRKKIDPLAPQLKTKVKSLQDFSIRKTEEFQRKKAEALDFAKQNNLKVRFEVKGVLYQLKEIKNGKPVYYMTDNANASISSSTNHVQVGGRSGLDLTGEGVNVGVWDGGSIRTTHQEFDERVTDKDKVATHFHATHVGGTISASGIDADAKGMATKVLVDSRDWNNDYAEMASAAANGLTLSNHSYGFPTGWRVNSSGTAWEWVGDPSISSQEDYYFGFYSEDTQNWDKIAHDAPYYLMVKSAGNDRGDGPTNGEYPQDGPFDIISHGGVAKNILTVGAVEDVDGGYSGPESVVMSSFSSWGPIDDGRIKPDISTNGVGVYSTYDNSDDAYNSISGTSMAAPAATGSIALLQEHWNKTHGGKLLASSMKAIVLHTADEAGPFDGPDYMFGWGLLNTEKAAKLISDDTEFINVIQEREITDGNTYTFNLTSDGTKPLRVTMVWTDVEGTPVAPALDPKDIMLVNDMDIKIEKDGDAWQPYKLDPAEPSAAATTGDNIVDNVELVHIANPVAGTYKVTVSHKGTLSGGSQVVSVISSGHGDIDEGVLKELAKISNQSLTTAGEAFTVDLSQYFENEGGNFTTIKFSVRQSKETLFTTAINGSDMILTPSKNENGTGILFLTATKDDITFNQNFDVSVLLPPDIFIVEEKLTVESLTGVDTTATLTIMNQGAQDLDVEFAYEISSSEATIISGFSNKEKVNRILSKSYTSSKELIPLENSINRSFAYGVPSVTNKEMLRSFAMATEDMDSILYHDPASYLGAFSEVPSGWGFGVRMTAPAKGFDLSHVRTLLVSEAAGSNVTVQVSDESYNTLGTYAFPISEETTGDMILQLPEALVIGGNKDFYITIFHDADYNLGVYGENSAEASRYHIQLGSSLYPVSAGLGADYLVGITALGSIPPALITFPNPSITITAGNNTEATVNFLGTSLPSAKYTGNIVVSTNDPSDKTVKVPFTFDLDLNSSDVAPTVANPIADIAGDEDVLTSQGIDLTNVFADSDNDDSKIIKKVVSNSNDALVASSIDGNTMMLSITPNISGTATLVVEGRSNSRTVTDTFTVTINAVNDPLSILDTMKDVTFQFGEETSYIPLFSYFQDAGAPEEIITYTTVDDNSNVESGLLDGRPYGYPGYFLTLTPNTPGTTTIKVTAEQDGESFEQSFIATMYTKPEMSLDRESIETETLSNTEKEEKFTVINSGESDLNISLGYELIFENTTFVTAVQSKVKRANIMTNVAQSSFVFKSIEQRQSVDRKKVELKTGKGTHTLSKIVQETFTDSLFYFDPSANTVSYKFDETWSQGVHLTSGADGFEVSHFGLYATFQDAAEHNITISIRDKDRNDLHMDAFQISNDTPGYMIFEFSKKIEIAANTDFYIHVAYDSPWIQTVVGDGGKDAGRSYYSKDDGIDDLRTNSQWGESAAMVAYTTKFVPKLINFDELSFNIDGAASQEVKARFNGVHFGVAQYQGNITVSSNDGSNSLVRLPFKFTLKDDPNDTAPVVNKSLTAITADEDAAQVVIGIDSVFTDSDNDDANIKVSVSSVSDETLLSASVNSKNELLIDLKTNANGEGTIYLKAISNNKSVMDSVKVVVNPVNDFLMVSKFLPDTITFENHSAAKSYDLNEYYTDPDNDISFTADTLNNGVIDITMETGNLTVTPRRNSPGKNFIKITATSDTTLSHTMVVIVKGSSNLLLNKSELTVSTYYGQNTSDSFVVTNIGNSDLEGSVSFELKSTEGLTLTSAVSQTRTDKVMEQAKSNRGKTNINSTKIYEEYITAQGMSFNSIQAQGDYEYIDSLYYFNPSGSAYTSNGWAAYTDGMSVVMTAGEKGFLLTHVAMRYEASGNLLLNIRDKNRQVIKEATFAVNHAFGWHILQLPEPIFFVPGEEFSINYGFDVTWKTGIYAGDDGHSFYTTNLGETTNGTITELFDFALSSPVFALQGEEKASLVAFESTSFDIKENESTEINLNFNAVNFTSSIYKGEIKITSTDLSKPSVKLPLTYTIDVDPNDHTPEIGKGLPDAIDVDGNMGIVEIPLDSVFIDKDTIDNKNFKYSLKNDAPLFVDASIKSSNGKDTLVLGASKSGFTGTSTITVNATVNGKSVSDIIKVTSKNTDALPVVIKPLADIAINEVTKVKTMKYSLKTVFTDADVADSIFVYTSSVSKPELLSSSVVNDSLVLEITPYMYGVSEVFVTATNSGKYINQSVTDTLNIVVSQTNANPIVNKAIKRVTYPFTQLTADIDLSTLFTDSDDPDSNIVISITSTNALFTSTINKQVLTLNFDGSKLGEETIELLAVSNHKTATTSFKVELASVDEVNPEIYSSVQYSNITALAKYVSIYTVPSEELNIDPVVRVIEGSSADTLSMSLINTDENLYRTRHKVEGSGSVLFEISAIDKQGNESDKDSIAVDYATVSSAISTNVTFGTNMFLNIPAGTFKSEGILFKETISKTTETEFEKELISPVFKLFAPAELNSEAAMTFTYRFDYKGDKNARKVGLYRKSSNEWLYVGGELENGVLTTEIKEFGEFALLYNERHEVLPDKFELMQNYPNPFNPETTIRFAVETNQKVVVKVYNTLGQLVKILTNKVYNRGRYQLKWKGLNDKGLQVSTGIYYYQIITPNHIATKRMVLIK